MFKPVAAPKCRACEKSVYAAEEKSGAGFKWHKACYRCGMCKTNLDSNNLACHDGWIFCKKCYARQFGPKGCGFGAGAGALHTDDGAQFSGSRNQGGMGSNF